MAGLQPRLPLRGQQTPVPGPKAGSPPSSDGHLLLERSHLPDVNLASHRPNEPRDSRCYMGSIDDPSPSVSADPQSGSACTLSDTTVDKLIKEEKNQKDTRTAARAHQHGTSPPTSPSTWNEPSTIEYEGRPHQVRAEERPRSRSPSVTPTPLATE